PDARLLVLEGLILGREAMGETVRQGHLADRWAIRREGALVFADALRLSGPIAEIAARPAVMNGARAALSLVYVAPDAGDRLERLRAVLPPSSPRETAGASAWDGMLAARAVVPDGQALVALMHRIVTALGPLAPPRGWAF
ncbi:MAG: urease accessory protein UreD, partial [Pseudomonadota bacterium]